MNNFRRRQQEVGKNREQQSQILIAIQYAQDAAVIAANETLGMGKGRAKAFVDSFNACLGEIAEMSSADGKELDVVKRKLDERIKQIVGEDNFVPWPERYAK